MPARACGCEKPSHVRSIARNSARSKAEKTERSAGEVLKEELRKAQDGIPRFLFRCWSNDPESASGGHQGLNTERAVTPLAYLNNDAVTSIFAQSESALRRMLHTHLTIRHPTGNEPPTQFSSWASSISVPFGFIHGRPNCYVAVLDTKHLRERGTFVAHVPALKFLDPDCVTYNWEYLVHGPASGMLYQAIPASKFNAIGFPERCKWGAEPLLSGEYPYSVGAPEAKMPGKKQIDDALAVAKGYSARFTTPVFLAIMTQKVKQPCLRADAVRHRELVEKLVALVSRCRLRVPIDWCAQRAIMQHGVVNTRGYPEVEAMLMCMRVLVLERYPKECAKKWPGLSREKVLGVEVEETVRETREWVENWDAESVGWKRVPVRGAGDLADGEAMGGDWGHFGGGDWGSCQCPVEGSLACEGTDCDGWGDEEAMAGEGNQGRVDSVAGGRAGEDLVDAECDSMLGVESRW